MNGMRWFALIFGPVVAIAGSYWMTYGTDGFQTITATGTETASSPQGTIGILTEDQRRTRDESCNEIARALKARLPDDFRIVVRSPYVLAGNVSKAKLERVHRDLIQPISRALHTCYFDRHPIEPIALLLFADAETYQSQAEKFDGKKRAWYSGYYQRDDRRVMVNVATGQGTIGHELTHALAHVDCPQLPEWFDEGFASLHEQCEFSDDGLKLIGQSNWRKSVLAEPLKTGRLPHIETLITDPQIRGQQESLTYAQSRYFCLYLQKRGLLAHYYRKLKATVSLDPTGRLALQQLLQTNSLDGFNRDFQKWLRTQIP